MGNSYFQFKRFRVEQDKCAMKVCTDSCVFGAYVEAEDTRRVLDIGAGTGLLSLMVAQRTGAKIDAVEINPEAQQQARDNFERSPWAERLTLHPMPLQEFAPQNQQPYDLILSNPPFFLSSLRSPDAARNTARHSGELFFEDITAFTSQHLRPEGKLCLLLPPPEAALFQKKAQLQGLHLAETLEVYTYHGGKCIRHIQTYTFSPTATPTVKSFYIREADKVTYTPAFAALLNDYYLIF
ncbi:tRNA1Val (adenine37-N6)-methyltransferase [Pontibacter ummariensis]|uniref:tRNA1(Val) (adenine(37)-N6)-methyltransferase n=1 Tax=Pontibacter ummariensis TaxID=1610492 RepID=A0A239EGU7_9BACT|nr:methyltransferase [Pontibacter ummariensis]PRY13227.1 tRNA1Val (adenine37-N6)-methyltransferase [Pontibacter ummariensis]SNS43233.1 tRNA1Val (adenine37-N6)-methyltransferase [Pontibacter ummariensis]